MISARARIDGCVHQRKSVAQRNDYATIQRRTCFQGIRRCETGSPHETERIVRQEPSEWPLVANNGPFPRIILLCPVEAYPSLTSGLAEDLQEQVELLAEDYREIAAVLSGD